MKVDPRAAVTGDGKSFAYAGRRFEFIPADKTSQQVAETALAEHVAAVIARREKLAGRKLTAAELAHGVERPNDLSLRDKQAADNWRPVTAPAPAGEPNPFKRLLADGAHLTPQPGQKVDREKMYQAAADEWDRKHQAADEAAARDADPKRARARKLAAEAIERVRFDPSLPQSALILAEQLAKQAEFDLGAFGELHKRFRSLLDSQHQQRVSAIDEQLTTLKAARAELVGEEFEPAPAPEPTPAPVPSLPPLVQMTQDELDRRFAETRAVDERRREAQVAERHRQAGGL